MVARTPWSDPMTPRLAPILGLVLLLAGCTGGEIPIYVGDERVGTLPGTGAGTAVAARPADECMALALRAADPAITDAQRRAAAEYRASLGC